MTPGGKVAEEEEGEEDDSEQGGEKGEVAGQVGDVAGEEPVQGDHDEDEDFQADVDGEEQDKVEIRWGLIVYDQINYQLKVGNIIWPKT